MIPHVRFTEEEKKEDKKEIKEMLLKNMSYTQIAEELGRSRQYICLIKKELVENNIITEEELLKIKEEEKIKKLKDLDEKVLYYLKQGYNKHNIMHILKKGNKDIDASIERLSKEYELSIYETKEQQAKQEELKKVCERIKKGYYKEQICDELNIPRTTLRRRLDELIKNGSIKESEIRNRKEEIKKSCNQRNEEIFCLYESGKSVKEISQMYNLSKENVYHILEERDKKRVYQKRKEKPVHVKEDISNLTKEELSLLSYLEEGFSYSCIYKMMNLDKRCSMEMIQKLIDDAYITRKQMIEKQNSRKQMIEDMVVDLSKQGYNQASILRKINANNEEITNSWLSRCIKRKLKEGLLESAEVEKQNNYYAIDKLILSYVKLGYTVEEIEKETNLTEGKIRTSKKRLVQKNWITEDEIEKARKCRLRKKKKEKQKEIDEDILFYIDTYGYTDAKIASILGVSEHYIYLRKTAWEEKKISKQEIKSRKKEAVKKKQEENEILKQKTKEEFYKTKEEMLKKIEKAEKIGILNKKYVENYIALESMDYSFTKEDFSILEDIILYVEEFRKEENIEYLIDICLKNNNKKEAMFLLNRYMGMVSKESLIRWKYQMKQKITNYQKIK